MDIKKMGPDISKSALIIVDMQNDFVHPDGALGHRARENPERKIDMPFLMGTIPNVSRHRRCIPYLQATNNASCQCVET